MSKVIEFTSREQVYDQASLWIARLDRQLTATEEQSLRRWLAENELHKSVFLEMAELWDKMDSLSRLADLFQAPAPKKQPYRIHAYIAVAASVAMTAIALVLHVSGLGNPYFSKDSRLTLVEAVYETAVGQHNKVDLPDGSHLRVNTNSLVRVEYTEDSRLFYLERGELNIEVAKDPARPLNVIAKGERVQAVGTAFNVRINDEHEVELLVTHGKVLVAKENGQGNVEKVLQKASPDIIAVSSGEKIILGGKPAQVAKVQADDIAAELSWREGNLVFRGETLEQALNEISRYTDVDFEIDNDVIRQQRIAGLFKAGDVDGLLVALKHSFHIGSERLDGNRIRLVADPQ